MAINRIEIQDFLAFRGEFAVDFCPGLNILIGPNATGKTTLMKTMYAIHETVADYVYAECGFPCEDVEDSIDLGVYFSSEKKIFKLLFGNFGNNQKNENIEIFDTRLQAHLDKNISMYFELNQETDKETESFGISEIFIPAQEMLSHSKGFLALSRERRIPFDKTQIDIISKAELGEANNLSDDYAKLLTKLSNVINGEIVYESDTFYTLKKSGERIEFPLEADGFRKFGLLWKLIRNGLLEKNSILFWDEPESNINPELMAILVDILLELQRNGVQIFIATHSEILASYFNVLHNDDDKVMFYSLYKDNDHIKADMSERFDLLTPNSLTYEQVKLYEKEIEKGLG
jgi:predicted ATP-dependent endonuclease of OLD family